MITALFGIHLNYLLGLSVDYVYVLKIFKACHLLTESQHATHFCSPQNPGRFLLNFQGQMRYSTLQCQLIRAHNCERRMTILKLIHFIFPHTQQGWDTTLVNRKQSPWKTLYALIVRSYPERPQCAKQRALEQDVGADLYQSTPLFISEVST